MSNPTATIRLTESTTEFFNQQNTGIQAIDETITSPEVTETISTSSTATLRITESSTESNGNTTTGSQNLSEKIAETVSSSATAEQTISEAQPGDTLDNQGTAAPAISEKIAETDTNTMTATTRINAYGDNTYSGGPYGG